MLKNQYPTGAISDKGKKEKKSYVEIRIEFI